MIYRITQGEKPVGGSILTVISCFIIYLWIFAATHVPVGINQRALFVDDINKKVIGVYDSGIVAKPMVGVTVQEWPANTQYQQVIDMQSGVDSATSKNGTPLLIDTTVFLDLSDMDIEAAYKAVNGDWNVFFEKNLKRGMTDVARNVSDDFTTDEHTFKRNEWVKQYEDALVVYFNTEGKGYGIKLVTGRSTMSWDFVNDLDRTAYDAANRAGYLTQQRTNEKAALVIESEMATIRSQMLSKTADGTVESLQKIADFIANQPAEIRPYIINYLSTMVDLEYLRLVGEQKPEQFLPPNSNTVPTYNTNNESSTVVVPTPSPSPTESN